MATHSSVLAWRIPGMGEPGGLPSMGHTELDTLKRLSKDPESLPLHLIDWTFKRHKTKNVTSYSISVLGVLSHVQLFVAAQTIAHQAPL